jgi:hypothetical protein
MSNPNHARIVRTVPDETPVSDGLLALGNVCVAGKQCPEVQGSPVALAALTALEATVATAGASLAGKLQLATALMTAIEVLHADYEAVLIAARTYESAVAGVAVGDAAIIAKAGLRPRATRTPATQLGKVSEVHSQPGKHPAESILAWPPGPGATAYAIEVSFTPQDPTAPWTALTSGSGRRRTVKGPTPGCQILARVASLASDGTQSEWSDVVLATTAT